MARASTGAGLGRANGAFSRAKVTLAGEAELRLQLHEGGPDDKDIGFL